MNALIRTILQRLGFGLITLFVVSVVLSLLVGVLPGDFATRTLGQAATPDTVAAFRREIGLDRPPVERYLHWLADMARGDFGSSYSGAGSLTGNRRAVADLIAPRLVNTLFLAGLAALIAVPLALTLGLLAALYRNGIYDRLVNLVTLTSISAPEFFVGYILALFLANDVYFQIFPAISTVEPGASILDRAYACALPALTLVLVIVAHMMRMTRASVINLLASPYIEMARLKGSAPRRVIVHHALPNAWAPISNVIALNLAYLIVGVVVVEKVFAYPGIGQLMVDAVRNQDVPVIQGCAMIFAGVYVLLNLAADIIAIATNPRLLHPR